MPGGSGLWEEVFAGLHRFAWGKALEEDGLAPVLKQFRSAAQAIPNGVIALDASHRIEWCNAAVQRHFNIDQRHDAGQPILNFVRQPEFRTYLLSRIHAEALVLGFNRDAKLTLSLRLVLYGGDRTLLMSRDMTELEQVVAVRRDFVANVSHEIKTPLTVVSGFLETIPIRHCSACVQRPKKFK